MKTHIVAYNRFREFLLESSLGDLERSTERAFDTDRSDDANAVRITNMVISPGQNTLSVNAQSLNTDKGSHYNTNLVFRDVRFQQQTTATTEAFTASDGNEYYVERLDMQRTQVEVSCNCLDFYWTFATWNGADNSLLGPAPDPYVKKTDRAPRNPTQSLGLCKHLYAIGAALRKEGILR